MKNHKLTREEIEKNIDEQTTAISQEFRAGFEFLKKYDKTVSIFGSTRALPESVHSKTAEMLAHRIVKELGFAIMTGGGPGIMRAACKGAREAHGKALGLSIDLPKEQKINEFVTDAINFNYFFSRKVMLSFAAEAYVFFPGGYGTLDELFGIMTLIQTNKIPRVPVILMGKDFWNPFNTFLAVHMCEDHATIDKSDMGIYTITDSIDEVIEIIKMAPISEWWEKTD